MNTGWNDMDIRWNIRAINLRRKCRVSCPPSRSSINNNVAMKHFRGVERVSFHCWIDTMFRPVPLVWYHWYYFDGNDPSPPLHLGDGPTTSTTTPPLSFTILSHFSGVMAIMLNAWTGPSAATSSFSVAFTSLWREIGVFASLNLSEMTTTLKCVSEPAGLW